MNVCLLRVHIAVFCVFFREVVLMPGSDAHSAGGLHPRVGPCSSCS